jgi:hypothetical protein
MRTWVKWFIPYIALVVVLVLTISNSNKVDELANDNNSLACSMARLISYVPAVQFKGEPDENFIGWVVARHDMLAQVREGTCSRDTIEALAERVQLDEQLLKQIGVDPNEVFTPSD